MNNTTLENYQTVGRNLNTLQTGGNINSGAMVLGQNESKNDLQTI